MIGNRSLNIPGRRYMGCFPLLRFFTYVYAPMNSILDWNDNLAAIFEAKLTYIDVQCQSPPIVLTCATTRNMPKFRFLTKI